MYAASRRKGMAIRSSLFFTAIVASVLLACNTSPSTTFFNQVLALGLWGALALAMASNAAEHQTAGQDRLVSLWPAMAALLLAGVGTFMPQSAVWQAISLAASAACTCAAAAVALHAGGQGGQCAWRLSLALSFLTAWLIAGLASSGVALVQVFAPSWPDGDVIAHSSVAGRAVGNLRQPNHLSSVLLWAAIALVGWMEIRRLSTDLGAAREAAQIGRPPRHWMQVTSWLCMALFIWAIVLTASRTGLVGVALLALWGLADRRLSRGSRWLLIATPVMYAIAWWGMAWWAQASEHTFGGQQRLAEGDISGSRFRIWADALQLIAAHPWTGVGWGNFNFAWSLTPFPNRHTAFFDHTHNLPLQLAVELGVPMALLICGLLLWALWQAWQRARAAEPAASAAGRCAVMMIVLIGLHSLLEYPLWYAYFLLPTAFVWGFALGLPPARRGTPTGQQASKRVSGDMDEAPASNDAADSSVPAGGQNLTARPDTRSQGQQAQPQGVGERSSRLKSWPLALAGALCVAGAVFSVFDYLRVADIFEARPGAAPLEQRIEGGKHSLFFAHHAHYAAATISDTPGQEMASFDIASHHLLDTRLMMAWAKGFAEVGDLERARHLAERLREFRNPASAEFFAECDKARSEGLAPSAWPFQCAPPARTLTWQDFLPARVSAQSVQEGR
jgi:hypothetical protein